MRFGEDLFLKMTPDFNMLKKYGFVKKGLNYVYSIIFLKRRIQSRNYSKFKGQS